MAYATSSFKTLIKTIGHSVQEQIAYSPTTIPHIEKRSMMRCICKKNQMAILDGKIAVAVKIYVHNISC